MDRFDRWAQEMVGSGGCDAVEWITTSMCTTVELLLFEIILITLRSRANVGCVLWWRANTTWLTCGVSVVILLLRVNEQAPA